MKQQIGIEIVEIAKDIMNIKLINPLNDKGQADKEKEKFFESDSYNPQFTYLPFDCTDLKKRLSSMQFPEMPDEIAQLYVQAKVFLERYIGMIENRGTADFTDRELYGGYSEELVEKAYNILNKPKTKLKKESKKYSAEQLKEMLKKEIDKLGLKSWTFKEHASSRSVSVSAARKEVSINPNEIFSVSRAKKLIVHEIDTHVLRGENGYLQDYALFASELIPGYLPIDEGLALLNEKNVGLDMSGSLRTTAGKVIAVHLTLSHSFRETFNELSNYFSANLSYNLTLRVKRGLGDTSQPGGFIKDHAYLQGFFLLEKFVEEGGDLRKLYAGKIGLKELPLVEKGLIKPAKYLPDFI